MDGNVKDKKAVSGVFVMTKEQFESFKKNPDWITVDKPLETKIQLISKEQWRRLKEIMQADDFERDVRTNGKMKV